MNRNLWTFIAVCAGGAFALVLLATWRAGPHFTSASIAPMTLRVHAVPAARAEEILGALAISLSMGEGQPAMGRVSSAGPGQLLVLAPESVQADVGRAIASLGGDAGGPRPSTTVMLELWSIDVLPGEDADDPSLAPIADALQAARGALGRVRFQLKDALSIASRTDSDPINARTPAGFSVGGKLHAADGGVSAQLMIGQPQLSTSLDLRFGEALVIARIAAAEGRSQLIVARVHPSNAPN